ncbi:hypothetical protein [Parasphingorhabdus marina]|uniref:hypothetical protein n=1 Tax=Parasphingorhabdus marina TaxID=394732 RepID=UPI0011610EBF|nr:hypothetical protein [Parasphingorhabdus marina]
MKRLHIWTGAFSIALLGQAASAQTLRSFELQGQSETRAVAKVTIPLGGQRSSADNTPRLDFAVQTHRFQPVKSDPALRFRANWDEQTSLQHQTSLSFTLEPAPRMLLNGKQLAKFGPTLQADQAEDEGGGGNTALWVIGGLVVAGAVLAVAVTADTINTIQELDE